MSVKLELMAINGGSMRIDDHSGPGGQKNYADRMVLMCRCSHLNISVHANMTSFS